jgi:hypothetical protein
LEPVNSAAQTEQAGQAQAREVRAALAEHKRQTAQALKDKAQV